MAFVAAAALGTASLAVLAAWAVAPLDLGPPARPEAPEALPEKPPDVPPPSPLAIDTQHFDVRIWNPVPPPPPSEPRRRRDAARPAPALPLQLVGIAHRDGARLAILYDPEADRLATLPEGARYRGREIVLVAADRVRIDDGDRPHELRLREDRP